MGWNGWNSFATTITEAQARETAAIMRDRLLPFGYDIFTVDIHKSVFFLCQAAARHMIPSGGGKIINIASMLTFQGGIRVPSYTAKERLGGLTKLLANEWAHLGINVNAMAPGYIATNNTAALQGDENA